MKREFIVAHLLIILAILTLPLQSQAYTFEECNAACAQLFPGGTVDPVTPPVTPTTKTCAMPVTFERAADQNDQKAAVLFRTLQDSQVSGVSVNGEVARRGRPYKGCPVFLLGKEGGQYRRPLKIVAQTSDGQTCTAVSGSSETPPGPTTPTGEYKHKASYDSYGERNGRQAWRINKKGPEFGAGPVKFVFSSGKEFIVYNTSKNCRDVPKSCGRNSKAPMYGFVFKPGIGPNGDGDSDTGTSHGGVYLQAPWKDSSKEVMVYW